VPRGDGGVGLSIAAGGVSRQAWLKLDHVMRISQSVINFTMQKLVNLSKSLYLFRSNSEFSKIYKYFIYCIKVKPINKNVYLGKLQTQSKLSARILYHKLFKL
jgi:hypothetical protein